MPDSTDPRPTRLEGFNANGVLIGIVELVPNGSWAIVLTGKWRRMLGLPWFVATEPEARDLLQRWGATDIRESGGRK